MFRKLNALILSVSMVLFGFPFRALAALEDPTSSTDPSIIQDQITGTPEEIQEGQNDLNEFVDNLSIAQTTEGTVTDDTVRPIQVIQIPQAALESTITEPIPPDITPPDADEPPPEAEPDESEPVEDNGWVEDILGEIEASVAPPPQDGQNPLGNLAQNLQLLQGLSSLAEGLYWNLIQPLQYPPEFLAPGMWATPYHRVDQFAYSILADGAGPQLNWVISELDSLVQRLQTDYNNADAALTAFQQQHVFEFCGLQEVLSSAPTQAQVAAQKGPLGVALSPVLRSGFQDNIGTVTILISSQKLDEYMAEFSGLTSYEEICAKVADIRSRIVQEHNASPANQTHPISDPGVAVPASFTQDAQTYNALLVFEAAYKALADLTKQQDDLIYTRDNAQSRLTQAERYRDGFQQLKEDTGWTNSDRLAPYHQNPPGGLAPLQELKQVRADYTVIVGQIRAKRTELAANRQAQQAIQQQIAALSGIEGSDGEILTLQQQLSALQQSEPGLQAQFDGLVQQGRDKYTREGQILKTIKTMATADLTANNLTQEEQALLEMLVEMEDISGRVWYVHMATVIYHMHLSGLFQSLAAPSSAPPASSNPAVDAPEEAPTPEPAPEKTSAIVPVSFTEEAAPLDGAELDAELNRIEQRFDRNRPGNVTEIDPNSPFIPELQIASNYINTLWDLMGPMGQLIENPAALTVERRNRMRTLFEDNFTEMIRRANVGTNGIGTGKAGIMLWAYLQTGLATPTRGVELYRLLRDNQDALLGRLATLAAGAGNAADFRTPYDRAMRPFEGTIGGVVATLNMVEARLVPMLSQGMAYMAADQRTIRDEILASASNRMDRFATLCEGANRLGIGLHAISAIALDDLYKMWADVMRAVANLVTAGEDATAPARAVYARIIAVSSRITLLIPLFHPVATDTGDGLSAAIAVLVEMPMQILPLLTDAQKTRLLEEYRTEFRALLSRVIAVASPATLTRAGTISYVVDGVEKIVEALPNLAGLTMTQAEWRTIYTDVGRAIQLAAARVEGMEAGFTRQSSVESLSNSAGAFAFALVGMLDNPPFAGLQRDPLRAITDPILAIFPPIIDRLNAIAAAPRQGENGDAMAQAVREGAQCGYEFLRGYIEQRLANAPVPEPDPVSTEGVIAVDPVEDTSVYMETAPEEVIQDIIMVEDLLDGIPVV